MPITQSRLLTLLESAERYQTLYNYLATDLRRLHTELPPEHRALVVPILLTLDGVNLHGANAVLAAERTHYKLTHAKNAAHKRRKAELRAAGAPESAQAPSPSLTALLAESRESEPDPEDLAELLAQDHAQAVPPTPPARVAQLDFRGLQPTTKAELLAEARRAAEHLAAQEGAGAKAPEDTGP